MTRSRDEQALIDKADALTARTDALIARLDTFMNEVVSALVKEEIRAGRLD